MNSEKKSGTSKKASTGKDAAAESPKNNAEPPLNMNKVKFEIYGEEMIEKSVKLSGNSGRVYLPPTWVGHNVKIIRID